MVDMDKFDRHIAKAKQISLKNIEGIEDTFLIEPLPFKYLGDFFLLMKKMSKAGFKEGEQDPQKVLDALDKETLDLISGLVYATMKQTYKDIPEDKLNRFIASNLLELFPIIMEVNLGNMQK